MSTTIIRITLSLTQCSRLRSIERRSEQLRASGEPRTRRTQLLRRLVDLGLSLLEAELHAREQALAAADGQDVLEAA